MKQYARCITKICRLDFPALWGNLVAEIVNYLQSGDEKGILTGLIALKCLVKKYEYEMEEDRNALYEIMNATFGILGNLINNYIMADN